MITNVEYINIIDSTEASLIVSDTSLLSVTNESDVVLNVFDSFDNFLFRKNYKGKNFPKEFSTQDDYYQLISNLISEQNLNTNGVYKFRYHFVDDIFDSLFIQSNKYIITEISADRTEVRLNPISKNELFIEKFNRFKEYQIINPRAVDINEFVEDIIKKNITNFYSNENVDNIISNLSFIVNGFNVTLFQFLSPFYTPTQVNNIIQNLTESFIKTEDVATEQIKNIILTNQSIIDLKIEYNQTPSADIEVTIENTIFRLFKENITDIILQQLDLIFDVDTRPGVTDGEDVLRYGCTNPKAINFDAQATEDDGTCEFEDPETGGPYPIYGCTDPNAPNYDPDANTDNGTCKEPTEPGPGDPTEPGGPEEPEPEEPYLFGDVNRDRNIDSKDADIVLQASVGNIQLTAYQKYLADVAAPFGKITSADALAILNKEGKTGTPVVIPVFDVGRPTSSE